MAFVTKMLLQNVIRQIIYVLLVILALLVAETTSSCNHYDDERVVETQKGRVRGQLVDCGEDQDQFYHGSAAVFRGIPYAEPPVGQLRFRKPLPVKRWEGTKNATDWGCSCPQAVKFTGGTTDINEDCLYLNIFTTSDFDPTVPKPVMVFIHGGGFRSGETATYETNGIITQFVAKGVVLVTIQYRLGILGMFTTINDVFPANLALWDQLEALRFVNQNIKFFGGDPYRVTVFGQSAGGCSVSALTYSPVAIEENLFNQAIMESGNVHTCMGVLQKGKLTYRPDYSKKAAMGICNISEQQWDTGAFVKLDQCLRNKTWEEIIEAQQGFPNWSPVVDDADGFFPNTPEELAQNRPLKWIMTGTNRDEAATLYLKNLTDNEITHFTKTFLELYINGTVTSELFGPAYEEVRRVLFSVYRDSSYPPLKPDNHIGWLKKIIELGSDGYVIAPTQRETDLWLRQSATDIIYLYTFDYEGRKTATPNSRFQPVKHSDELVYLFRLNATAYPTQTYTANDLIVSEFLAVLWTNFAIYGEPTPSDASLPLPAKWNALRYSASTQHLSITEKPTMVPRYYAKRVSTWNVVIPAIIGAEKRDMCMAQFRNRFANVPHLQSWRQNR